MSIQQETNSKMTKKSFWRNKTKAGNDLKTVFKNNLKMIVLDEADAMITLGYDDDLRTLFKDILGSRNIENRYQAILCSATLNAGVRIK